jgi:hypothetical protein
LFNLAQPNIDTIYRMAKITPGGSYRICGRSGSVAIAVLSQALPHHIRTGSAWPELDLSACATDESGRYAVVASPARPPGHGGEWWQLHPETDRLMLRFVSSDWSIERAPTISIERIDMPLRRARPSAASLEARLLDLPARFEAIATVGLTKPAALRAQGCVNRFKGIDSPGKMAAQSNFETYYEIGDDEALIIEMSIPDSYKYISLLLANELYQTIDWYNNHSSLNNAQYRMDQDGKLRIVVAARDPGIWNWLDTAGHPRGVIKGRWTGCDSQPLPDVHRVQFDDVGRFLPAETMQVTLTEREALLRERRRALMERPLW